MIIEIIKRYFKEKREQKRIAKELLEVDYALKGYSLKQIEDVRKKLTKLEWSPYSISKLYQRGKKNSNIAFALLKKHWAFRDLRKLSCI